MRAGGNTLVIFTITVAGLAQVPVRHQAGVGEANAGREVRQRLAGLDADRQAIDAPRLALADSLGSSARLADSR